MVEAEYDMKSYYDEGGVIKAVDQGGWQLQISYNKIVHVLQKSQIQKWYFQRSEIDKMCLILSSVIQCTVITTWVIKFKKGIQNFHLFLLSGSAYVNQKGGR